MLCLQVTKHEQWHFKRMHAHTHTRGHAYTCARPYRSLPRSQICLLLLSKPAVKSSIICIHHLPHCSQPPELPLIWFSHPHQPHTHTHANAGTATYYKQGRNTTHFAALFFSGLVTETVVTKDARRCRMPVTLLLCSSNR